MSDASKPCAPSSISSPWINLFRGRSGSPGGGRVFGGQVVAQALVAAQRTVDETPSPIPPRLFSARRRSHRAIIYEVDRIRDGKSFTTRRVVAIQHGRAIYSMAVSFQVPEEGIEHQSRMPDVPPPEASPSDEHGAEKLVARFPPPPKRDWMALRPLEVKPVGLSPSFLAARSRGARPGIWFRTRGALPDDVGIPGGAGLCLRPLAAPAALVPHGRSVFDADMQWRASTTLYGSTGRSAPTTAPLHPGQSHGPGGARILPRRDL